MASSNAVRSELVNGVRVVQPAVGQGSDPISDQFQIQGWVGNEVEDAPSPGGEENGT